MVPTLPSPPTPPRAPRVLPWAILLCVAGGGTCTLGTMIDWLWLAFAGAAAVCLGLTAWNVVAWRWALHHRRYRNTLRWHKWQSWQAATAETAGERTSAPTAASPPPSRDPT